MNQPQGMMPCPNPFGKDHRYIGEPRLVNMSLAVYEGKYHTYEVGCDCGLHAEQKSNEDEAVAQAEAIAAWNTRPPTPTRPLSQEVVGKIEQLCKMTPHRPMAITWENGNEMITFVQDELIPTYEALLQTPSEPEWRPGSSAPLGVEILIAHFHNGKWEQSTGCIEDWRPDNYTDAELKWQPLPPHPPAPKG